MAEWLLNSELPSLEESEMSKYRLFKLFSFVFYHCGFYVFFILDVNALTSHCLQWRNINSVMHLLMLSYVTENRYVNAQCTFSTGTFSIQWAMKKII